MIILDGSYLEGGGQILRTALALSTLTQTPFTCFNIRKGRCEGGGLKPQHLYCIKALEQLCGAKVLGAKKGSSEITYEPGQIKARNLEIDIETAGSATLLMQSLLLPCLFANNPMKIKLVGGTDVSWSMPYDYFENILIPYAEPFAEKIWIKLEKRGFHPKGGGIIDIRIKPKYKINDYGSFNDLIKDIRKDLGPINLVSRGEMLGIEGVSVATKDLEKAQVAERQISSAQKALSEIHSQIKIEKHYVDALSPGSALTLWALFEKTKLGADCLGQRSKRSEQVGKEAADALLHEIYSAGAVDEHMSDNLLLYLALRGGSFTTTRVTDHCRTNIWTIEHFLGKRFTVQDYKISSD